MHTVTIGIDNTMLTLQFKDGDAADAAFEKVKTAIDVVEFSVLVKDDYAREVMIRPAEIKLLMLTDADRTAEADIEAAMIAAKANARLQTRAAADPSLRMAMNGAPQMAPATRVLGRG